MRTPKSLFDVVEREKAQHNSKAQLSISLHQIICSFLLQYVATKMVMIFKECLSTSIYSRLSLELFISLVIQVLACILQSK